MIIYQAISKIMGEMAAEGIGKNSKNKQQGWQFRGIDAVYNALAPKLSNHGVIIFTRCMSRQVTEKQTKNGGNLFYVVVECEFDFVSAEDGSKHTVKTFGEAMDSGDKGTNKAMSIALKYAAFQTFFIPTEVNTNDPDASSYTVSPNQPQVIEMATNEAQASIQAHAESFGFSDKQVCDFYKIQSLAQVPMSEVNNVIDTITSWSKQ